MNVSDEVWTRTLDVNLTRTMWVCRAALPLLRERAIVNIASVAAFNASPDSVSYAASKAAVVSYTRSLAYAHGADGVRSNAVAPGWVRTPMSAYEMQLLADRNGTTADVEFQSVERRIALGRMASPAEIAACCLFLASDDAGEGVGRRRDGAAADDGVECHVSLPSGRFANGRSACRQLVGPSPRMTKVVAFSLVMPNLSNSLS